MEPFVEFVSDHSNFKSSAVLGVVTNALENADGDYGAIALIPLKYKIFDFDTALRWGYFVFHVARVAGSSFDIANYAGEIVTIYDIAAADMLYPLHRHISGSDASLSEADAASEASNSEADAASEVSEADEADAASEASNSEADEADEADAASEVSEADEADAASEASNSADNASGIDELNIDDLLLDLDSE
jgi:hypothetical protein